MSKSKLGFTIAAVAAITLVLALSACFNDKKPLIKASGPIVGEFVSEDGSKLTFTHDGGKNWKSGEVLVELAADAEYILEGRANNTVYRYKFNFRQGDAMYVIPDDMQLSDGAEWFAKCRFTYMLGGTIWIEPYSREDVKIVFQRVVPEYPVNTGEGGTYDLVPGEGPYYSVTRR